MMDTIAINCVQSNKLTCFPFSNWCIVLQCANDMFVYSLRVFALTQCVYLFPYSVYLFANKTFLIFKQYERFECRIRPLVCNWSCQYRCTYFLLFVAQFFMLILSTVRPIA